MDNKETTKDGGRLPLTRSLEADVLAYFNTQGHHQGLGDRELVTALTHLTPDQNTLLDALSEAGYDQLDSDSACVLCWIDATFACWANTVRWAPEIQQLVNRSRPLAAAFALRDSRFFTPGAHGLHRLLDVLYDCFKGWHAGLGDKALNMLRTTESLLERLQTDFPSEPLVDEIRTLLEQKLHDQQAQLEQFDNLLLEREFKHLGEDAIRQAAAWLINTAIAEVSLPEAVAQFIASDWYESGVCIAEKNGFDSTQWRTFMDTTQLLVDVVQPVSPTNGDALHRLYMTMQQISITLSKQLISLQDNTEAVASTVGLIEYAMLRNLRGEDLGLQQVDLIAVGDGNSLPISSNDLTALNLRPGHWFVMQTATGAIRLRFAGTLINNYYLVFTDLMGNRILRKSLHEFRTLISSGEVHCLETPDSFCLAMASAIELRREQQPTALSQPEPTPNRIDYASTHGDPTHDDPTSLSKDDMEPKVEDEPTNSENTEPGSSALNINKNHSPRFNEPSYESNTIVKLQIPMGTWLGFHDRDPPLMAKIVACDLEKNSYIFTNREGIKMRELTVPQLVALIDRDMVDILERKTNFRETASQLFQQQERLDRRP